MKKIIIVKNSQTKLGFGDWTPKFIHQELKIQKAG